MPTLAPDAAQLWFSLQRQRRAGTLSTTDLRDGAARLADTLADMIPKGSALVIVRRRYEHPDVATSGLTRDGRALGRDIYLPYQGRAAHASDAELLAFLDEYPAVVEAVAAGLRQRSRAADELAFALDV